MRRAFLAVPAALLMILAVPAAAQTTKPSADLEKANAALRAYVEKLEARIAEKDAKIRELEATMKKLREEFSRPRADVRPFTPQVPAPYGFELPQQPFKIPTPAPTQPRNELRILPGPGQQVPDNWRRRQFNGQEYYLIPLR
jgi:uncharacterized coiled-coil protein SlyX